MSKCMKILAFLLVCAASLGAWAQASGQPGATAASAAAGPEISGMYSFLKDGEFVQVTVEEGRVSGFVSRYGDLDSDRGAFLDQFFDKASLEGKQLSFITKHVHGVWFEFKGTVQRGDGKTPQDAGYRTLKGTLTEYTEDASQKPAAKSREVLFKSFPQDTLVSRPKKD